MPQPKNARIERSRNILDRRAGYRITATWGHVSLLEGGGHICELILNNVPWVNPLWKPPWTTIDPDQYTPARHRRAYGAAPDGKLLAGIAGHNLSFDHFGPPSKEETAAGLWTHGEAPCMRWKMKQETGRRGRELNCSCVLAKAQISFTRTITVDEDNPVVYCEERAENLGCYDRPISWNEHVTFGPPFLDTNSTIFDMSATQSKVCPPGYSERIFLQSDSEFVWPHALTKHGKLHDLRTMPNHRYGHYTAQLLDPSLETGFVSACNPRQRLLVIYAFRRADFPWVGNWEEHNNRTTPPWKGKTFCRGMEFSTTPFAIPRRETIEQGSLFGQKTYRWLPAKSNSTVRYVIMLFHTPEQFAGVSQVTFAGGRALVNEAAPGERQLSHRVRKFV
jgi:hypothetical protein